MGTILGVLAVFIAGAIGAYWWSVTEERKAKESANRARLIYSARADEHSHPSIMSPPKRRIPADKPPALAGAPTPDIDPDNRAAIEHHAAEGVAAAQFMLDKLWTQKGYNRP